MLNVNCSSWKGEMGGDGGRLKIQRMLEDEYPMMFAKSNDDIDRAGDVYERLCKREEQLDAEIVRVKESIVKQIKDDASEDQGVQELDQLISKAMSTEGEKSKKKVRKKSKGQKPSKITKFLSPQRAAPARRSLSSSRRSKPNLLPMTPIDPDHKIRFHHVCSGLVKTEDTPGCPRLHLYRNGDQRLLYKDGTEVIIHDETKFTHFPNGDKQQEFADGAVAYMYAVDGTVDFRHPDGTRVLQFRDGRRDRVDAQGNVSTTYHTTALCYR